MEGIYLSPDMFNPDTIKNVFLYDEIIGSIENINSYVFARAGKSKHPVPFDNECGAIEYIAAENSRRRTPTTTPTVNPAQTSLF